MSNNSDKAPVIDANQISSWSRESILDLRAGGVDCVQITCAVWEGAKDTLRNIGIFSEGMHEWADLVLPVNCVSDIARAQETGRVGVMLGFQNTSPLEGDVYLVEQFARLGVKVMQLTYNNQNDIGSGCFEAEDSGLTRFGKQVVSEMNDHGVLVDLSHVGERTSLDAIEHSSVPVAITHANPLFWFESPRNKSNDLLQTLAAAGGVIGCTLYPLFIGGADTPLSSFTAMVGDLVELIGVEHVGLGSDLVTGRDDEALLWWRSGYWQRKRDAGHPTLPPWPKWFSSSRDFPTLREGLQDRGFSNEELDLIMGGNWNRLFSEVIG